MIEKLLAVGDEVAVSVFRNGESIGAIILKRTAEVMVECDIYANNDLERRNLVIALEQALVSLQFTFQKNDIAKAIKKRIAEMKENHEGSEEKPDSPVDDLDFPF